MSGTSNSKNDSGLAGLLAFSVGCAVVYAIVLGILNGAAWLLSSIASLIDMLSAYPLSVLKFTSIKRSLPFTYGVGWFVFFSIFGSIVAVLIAHILLPTATPTVAFDEQGVQRWEGGKLILCIVLFLVFLFILWKY